MRYIDILIAFETEIGLINNTIEKPSVDDSLFWINQSVGKFVKLRFNGDFVHSTGYEQTEKRRSDLIKLFKQKTYGLIDIDKENDSTIDQPITYRGSQPNYDQYAISYPSDFLYAINEDVVICDKEG